MNDTPAQAHTPRAAVRGSPAGPAGQTPAMPAAGTPDSSLPHVVVIGAGFGGLSAVQALRGAPVRITVIDQRNHHLFQPLLYQVATAGLSPADIAAPIRSIVGRQPGVTVIMGEVFDIDPDQRQVHIQHTSVAVVPYDYLVVATGARHSYFGHDEWAADAPGLKTIEDATFIRRRILLAFERAETETDSRERDRLLTFIVIGGGPTGVEMAGAISELARRIIARDFSRINPQRARILLIEAGPRLLAAFAEDSSAYALTSLEKLGVEVRLNARVTAIDPDGVQLGEERIETRTAIWAAGVQASAAAQWLGETGDRAGRVKVTDRLSLPDYPEVFVIGDTAQTVDAEGNPVPGLAPAAKEQGRYAGRTIRAMLRGKPVPPFRYRHYGNLATIGRRSAVIEFGRFHLKGYLAWLLWGVAHIFFLIGFRNRIVVMINWLWSYLWFRGGARLITGIRRD
ncbi:MAG: NAD(P)/FAD-dependent oxidoreductase [Acetobacteraceae bacterium]